MSRLEGSLSFQVRARHEVHSRCRRSCGGKAQYRKSQGADIMEDSQIASNFHKDLHDAQLENLKLEKDKLKLEIQSLTRMGNWTDKVQKYIPVITALIAVTGFWLGVYQFHRQE